MSPDLLESVTQFGVAGLMGVLWVWERWLSRRQESQLRASHARLMRQHDELSVLIRLVQRNTASLERFEQTQRRLCRVLDRLTHRPPDTPRQAEPDAPPARMAS
jgi:hypothetical protein